MLTIHLSHPDSSLPHRSYRRWGWSGGSSFHHSLRCPIVNVGHVTIHALHVPPRQHPSSRLLLLTTNPPVCPLPPPNGTHISPPASLTYHHPLSLVSTTPSVSSLLFPAFLPLSLSPLLFPAFLSLSLYPPCLPLSPLSLMSPFLPFPSRLEACPLSLLYFPPTSPTTHRHTDTSP
jgi:hypothetical protein